MVHIYYGSDIALYQSFAKKYHELKNVVWIDSESIESYQQGFPRYWAGMRTLLPQIRTLIGEKAFNQVIEKNKGVASVLYYKLIPSLTSSELEARNIRTAKVVSNLSHNYFVQYLLLDDWSLLIKQLLEYQNITILIPKLTQLDGPSLTILRSVCQHYPEVINQMHIGHNPALIKKDIYDEKGEPILDLDKNGLLWGHTHLGVQSIIYSLRCLADTQETYLDAVKLDLPKKRPAISVDSLDLDLAAKHLKTISNNPNALNATVISDLLLSLNSAFEAYDFDLALPLGLKILEYPILDEQKAFVHTVVGLSAHNRQFETFMAKEKTNDFLEYHFIEALKYEKKPIKRAFLYYRMAVTKGRRKKQFEEAIKWADQAIEIVQGSEFTTDEATMVQAWGLNIRAYLYARLRKMEQAKQDIELAYSLVATDALKAENKERELIFTASLIADNAATVYDYADDLITAKKWLHKSDLIAGPHDANSLFTPKAWVQIHRRMLRPDLGLKAATIGLNKTRKILDPFLEDLYLMNLGDLHYRMGNAQQALIFYKQCMKLHEKYHDKKRLLIASTRAGLSATKATNYEEAEEIYQLALSNENSNTLSKAEIYALKAVNIAKVDEKDNALFYLNEAIEWSIKDGSRAIMLNTAYLSAQVCLILNDTKEAFVAFQQFDALLKDDPHPEEHFPKLLIQMYLSKAQLANSMEEKQYYGSLIMKLLSAPILQQHSEVWWCLKGIGKLLNELEVLSEIEQAYPKHMTNLLLTLKIRVDCKLELEYLLSKVSNNTLNDYQNRYKDSDRTIVTGQEAQLLKEAFLAEKDLAIAR